MYFFLNKSLQNNESTLLEFNLNKASMGFNHAELDFVTGYGLTTEVVPCE